MRDLLKLHARIAQVAMVLIGIGAPVLAQSPPEPLSSVASAVVAVGVVALDPPAGSSAAASMAERPASIHGSGFFVSKNGDVITALHVVRAAEQAQEQMQGTENRLFIGLPGAAGFAPIPAELVGVDEVHDLALLRIIPPRNKARQDPAHREPQPPTASSRNQESGKTPPVPAVNENSNSDPASGSPTRSAINFVKLSPTRPKDGALIEAAGLPAMTGLAMVFNTGHLADTMLLRPGNFIVKSPAQGEAAQRANRHEFYLADLKSDEGMSGGPVYLVDNGAVIGVVHGYTQDPRQAVLVPARYVIELLKRNHVEYKEFRGEQFD